MEEIRIEDIIRPGTTIKTQVQDSRDWIVNSVVNLYSNTDEIEIIYDDRYLNMLVLVGDAMKIAYREDEWEYIIEAWITGIKIEPNKIITLKTVSVKKIANLRKDERYSVNYGATIYGINSDNGMFGVITNISVSGLGLITRGSFMVGEIIRICIMLPSSTFYIDAEIVRSSENSKGTEYGVRFIRDDEEALNEIVTLINDIKEREDRLSRIVGFNTL